MFYFYPLLYIFRLVRTSDGAIKKPPKNGGFILSIFNQHISHGALKMEAIAYEGMKA